MRSRLKNAYFIVALVVLFALGALFIKFFSDRSEPEPVGAGAGLPAAAFVDETEPTAEFLADYYEGMSELNSEEHQENILIVTSLTGIPDDHGATKVVAGPNHQYFLLYDSEEAKDSALSAFRESTDIAYVDENILHQVEDVSYNSWGISGTKMDSALAYASTRQDLNDVTVAVIDSGCDAALVSQFYPGKISEYYNAVTNKFGANNISEEHGHGTHVIGTIAEGTPDNVKILAIKAGSGTSGGLYSSAILAGLNYIIQNEKADVINMSYGAYVSSVAEETALENARQKGIVSVAAAGNDNSSLAHYPSSYSSTLSISSVTSDYEKSYFSNYGSHIDFAAPGSDILSLVSDNVAMSDSKKATDDEFHGTASGTSMAAPHASAAVAILKSHNKSLNLENTTELLKQYAVDLGASGRDDYFGYGLITFANSEFCADASAGTCDEFSVFETKAEQSGVTKLAIDSDTEDPVVLPYTYGDTYTNLSGVKVRFYYGDDFYVTKPLYLLLDEEGTTLSGYSPTTFYNQETGSGIQTVTVAYQGKTLTFDTATLSNSGYSIGADAEGNYYIIALNSDESVYPASIKIPEKYFGYDIYGISYTVSNGYIVGAFAGQEALQKVSLPSTLKYIDQLSFYSNQALTKVEFSEGLEEIGYAAFAATGLESLDLPSSLKTIGKMAFFYTSLDKIHIPANVESIGDMAFAGTGLGMTSVSVDPSNTHYDSGDNGEYIAETATHTLIKGYSKSNIGSEISAIGAGAFAYEDNMPHLFEIPSSVTSIGEKAFYGITGVSSGLKSLNFFIPGSVETIGTDAFKASNTNLMIYTSYNSAAANFASTNKLAYQAVEYSDVKSELTGGENVAFKAAAGNLRVYAKYSGASYTSTNTDTYSETVDAVGNLYNGDIANASSSDLSIIYQDPSRSTLLATDTHITIKGKDLFDGDYESECAVTVSKATPTYTLPSDLQGQTGQTLSTVSLPEGFSWDAPDTILARGEHEYQATYTPSDTDNYNIVSGLTLTVNVTGKIVVTTTISVADKTYDGTTDLDVSNITVEGLAEDEFTITKAVSSTADAKQENTRAIVTLKLSDAKFEEFAFAGEQQEASFEAALTINPKPVAKPTAADKSYTFDGTNQTFELVGFDAATMKAEGNVQQNAGTHIVTISLLSANFIWTDHTTSSFTLPFVIAKAAFEIEDSTKNAFAVQDSEPHSISLELKYTDNATIKYKDSDGNFTLSEAPEYTEAGLYVISYQVHLDDNHEDYVGKRILVISEPEEAETPGENSEPSVVDKDGTLYLSSENSFDSLSDKFQAPGSTSKHLTKDRTPADSDKIKTGDILQVETGGETFEYQLIYRGDVNGDGDINVIDYIRIIKKIMNTEGFTLEGIYYKAADMNDDNLINVIDYIRIISQIM